MRLIHTRNCKLNLGRTTIVILERIIRKTHKTKHETYPICWNIHIWTTLVFVCSASRFRFDYLEPSLAVARKFKSCCCCFQWSMRFLNWKKWQIFQLKIIGLNIPTGWRQTSWLFTNRTEELDYECNEFGTLTTRPRCFLWLDKEQMKLQYQLEDF